MIFPTTHRLAPFIYSPGRDGLMRLKVLPLIGRPRTIEVETSNDTVIKHVIERVREILGISEPNLRLSLNGRVLDEMATLEEEGAEEGETYYLFPQGEGG